MQFYADDVTSTMDSQSIDYDLEYLKCRENPFYFIYNYVYLPEIGGGFKLTSDNLHSKMKRVVRSVVRFHNVELMASRQLGKSSIAACLIAWASVFYSDNKVVILNMKKNAAQNNLMMVKFIVDQLPNWMITNKPFISRSDIKSYIQLYNNSKVEAFYPSTVHSTDTLSRALTSAILYIDEAAFIREMSEAFGSAQQILSRAREQAKKRNYPYFILVTSTPF